MRQFPIFAPSAWLRPAAVLACAWLSACVSVTVDERTAFAPPKREQGPATSVAELDTRVTARLKGWADQGRLRLDPEPSGGTRITYLQTEAQRAAGQSALPTSVFTNGFIDDGKTRVAWTFYRAPDAPAASPRPLVVHCAGNAGDRYNSGPVYASKVMPWADVLIFDYPGYGDTPGPASAANFEAAAQGLITHVTGLSQNRKLVFWGHSLGGFVCSRLAALTPGADGLVLETTAPNAAAVARAWTPSYARLFVRANVAPSLQSYDVVAASAQVSGPVLVLGATKDETLPVTLARQVADGLKARNARVTYQEYPDAKHHNVSAQKGFADTVADFFKTVESQP
jgi:pimeloyl-ACP methyl ester carboxylesterase